MATVSLRIDRIKTGTNVKKVEVTRVLIFNCKFLVLNLRLIQQR